MTKLIFGFFLGIVISTVGFSGLFRVVDQAINTIKNKAEEISK